MPYLISIATLLAHIFFSTVAYAGAGEPRDEPPRAPGTLEALFDISLKSPAPPDCDSLLIVGAHHPYSVTMVPMAMLTGVVELTAQDDQGFVNTFIFGPRGKSMNFIFGSKLRPSTIFRIDADGTLRRLVIGTSSYVITAQTSPAVAQGLIRYSYYHSRKNIRQLLLRLPHFILAETPELFMPGWQNMYGLSGFSPTPFIPERDLNQ